MRKFSFTLVEILVAMTIIGVVAVLTIPSVIDAYQKKMLTTQLQRAYAEISHAVDMVMLDEGEVDDFKSTKAIEEKTFLGKYLTVNGNNGFAPLYDLFYNEGAEYDLKGKNMGNDEEYFKCGVTKAGAGICVNKDALGILDINGTKGPNLVGRDAFRITFTSTGRIISYGYGKPLENIIKHGWDLDEIDN